MNSNRTVMRVSVTVRQIFDFTLRIGSKNNIIKKSFYGKKRNKKNSRGEKSTASAVFSITIQKDVCILPGTAGRESPIDINRGGKDGAGRTRYFNQHVYDI